MKKLLFSSSLVILSLSTVSAVGFGTTNLDITDLDLIWVTDSCNINISASDRDYMNRLANFLDAK